MILRNIIFSGVLQHGVLAAAAALCLASLIVKGRKNRLRLFFFFLLACALYSFILYFGVLFFLLAFAVFGFYVMLTLYSTQRERYYYADLSACSEDEPQAIRLHHKVLRLFFPLLLCSGLAGPFLLLSHNYFSQLGEPSAPATVSLLSMATELFNSFHIHFLIIITTVFAMVLWTIVMAENAKENP